MWTYNEVNPPLQVLLIRISTLLPGANHLWTLIVRQKMKQSVKQWWADEEERLDTSVGSHRNSCGKRNLNHKNSWISWAELLWELICKYSSSTTCLIWICRGVKPCITAPANDFLLKALWVALSVFARSFVQREKRHEPRSEWSNFPDYFLQELTHIAHLGSMLGADAGCSVPFM